MKSYLTRDMAPSCLQSTLVLIFCCWLGRSVPSGSHDIARKPEFPLQSVYGTAKAQQPAFLFFCESALFCFHISLFLSSGSDLKSPWLSASLEGSGDMGRNDCHARRQMASAGRESRQRVGERGDSAARGISKHS